MVEFNICIKGKYNMNFFDYVLLNWRFELGKLEKKKINKSIMIGKENENFRYFLIDIFI